MEGEDSEERFARYVGELTEFSSLLRFRFSSHTTLAREGGTSPIFQLLCYPVPSVYTCSTEML